MSFFPNATGVMITNSTFLEHHPPVRRGRGLKMLYESSHPAAAHDSAAHEFAAERLSKTRHAGIVEDLVFWSGELTASGFTMWIIGPRSNLAHLCSERLEDHIAATFFFGGNPESLVNDPNRFFPTIAHQLSTRFPVYRDFIDSKLQSNPELIHKNLKTQFRELISIPLQEMIRRGGSLEARRLIIVDALDQCKGDHARSELLRIITTEAQDLPFAWLVFSEPEIASHDWLTNLITGVVIVGLFISYAPQHYRIISSKTSEGLSPLFLLLGSTSSAAGMWNMLTMQSGVAKCCSVVGFGRCIELIAGIFQVSVQWFCFTFVFFLYMKFYPERLKYVELDIEVPTHDDSRVIKTPIQSSEWRFSILCARITLGHFIFCSLTTIYLLVTAVPPPSPEVALPAHIQSWATFLGVHSAILAAIQYAPQLIHTYQHKLVGALSIPMMCIQSPGAVFMILGIALRPGTNWTSWFTYLVAGLMQSSLLIMCIAWKIRQRRLGIDDFGNPVEPDAVSGVQRPEVVVVEEEEMPEDVGVAPVDERTPLVGRG
ncbi:hypothetical protein NP233_g9016 [Leucocoprinus birnbaumii]|uniref:Nephrocystin 3-like N-terminal domain-containing protein n=1 Tax=Leucocoprinus birnbaumii TaxID=56174 RepID=A0AAD5VRV3_9AGAR|nr:hypothetical protein NP233_g9016 [Leucocoprinus birnbaumii]